MSKLLMKAALSPAITTSPGKIDAPDETIIQFPVRNTIHRRILSPLVFKLITAILFVTGMLPNVKK